MKGNLADLSEAELANMIENAQKALKEKKETKRKEVISKIKELAASIGVNVDITEGTKVSGRKGSKVPVKYQNPNNLSQKWTGRGMKPKWLQTLIEQGHKLEDFEVKS
ncbi:MULTISPECIES: H-NS histone family protein [Methylocaldum]|jgi:DNA-binding protein H-NS|uniref:H-NS histone family protein n=1 Tax=unclassified Methylocaldum TaxID=2622260 RepID=UPI00098B9D06|nr:MULTISPECIES: H-NS histone family protein [unclassified Methylocaldum]MBP1148749.1 DNA-binding protein H-NS [Methylocaldum sp. RMAD-M]MDV3240257.1 H-NS histone family protein [Methylocaldum sp.]MVF20783.1 H-NS histone family protein [Methylocaldum sp. BRCS4]